VIDSDGSLLGPCAASVHDEWLLAGDFYLLGLSLELPFLVFLQNNLDIIAKPHPELFFISGMRCEDGGHHS
jgi:hypothetical protein